LYVATDNCFLVPAVAPRKRAAIAHPEARQFLSEGGPDQLPPSDGFGTLVFQVPLDAPKYSLVLIRLSSQVIQTRNSEE
jgi:hypothetical protein